MASIPPELQKLIHAGVAAIQSGDKAKGIEHLLKVVEQNDQIETAWVWLSRVVDDPADQITALENVLIINPDSPEANERLAQLRAPAPTPGQAAPPLSSDDWRKLLPEVTLETDDGMDNPLQCVFCGGLTAEKDRKCPRCGQKLYVTVTRSKTSSNLRFAILLVCILWAFGVGAAVGPVLAYRPAWRPNLEFVLLIPGVKYVIGDLLKVPAQIITYLLGYYGARAGLLAFFILGLTQRWTIAYYGSILVVLVDLLAMFYLAFMGYLGIVLVVANVILTAVALYLLFSSDREFAVNEERLYTRPDGGARSGQDFYRRGHNYRSQGMWALAVAQWRRAVGLAPKEISYYKDLGIGYAQIKRYPRSLRVLKEALRLAPEDSSVAELIQIVEKRAAATERNKK